MKHFSPAFHASAGLGGQVNASILEEAAAVKSATSLVSESVAGILPKWNATKKMRFELN